MDGVSLTASTMSPAPPPSEWECGHGACEKALVISLELWLAGTSSPGWSRASPGSPRMCNDSSTGRLAKLCSVRCFIGRFSTMASNAVSYWPQRSFQVRRTEMQMMSLNPPQLRGLARVTIPPSCGKSRGSTELLRDIANLYDISRYPDTDCAKPEEKEF